MYNLLLLPTLLHHELKTRFLHSRIGQFNIQIQCVSSSHAENTVREPNPTQTPQSLRPLSSVTSALPVCLSVCLFRIRSRLLHGFSANTCSSPQSSPNNYKATKASSANVITAYVSPSPSSPLLSLPTAITNIPLPLQGNYSARVIKRNPWFTFCFIPVIPLSVHGYEDVVGLSDRPNRNYASELSERGFVTISPSYPEMAAYQPDIDVLGYASGTMKAIWDNSRGLDLLASFKFVDSSRGFGAIGHSLGGHNAIYTSVFDKRITVIASSCGFDSYQDYYDGAERVWKFGAGWCQIRYMPRLSR